MLRRAHILAFLSLVSYAHCDCNTNTATTEAFSQTQFDYVVIGGGTAGIALSARLSEDSTITVGVIEAGSLHVGDQNIEVPGLSGFGNPRYDWNFLTTPQTHAANRQIPVSRGKLVGGSSGLNFMAWGRASTSEYDSWSKVAEDDTWSWSNLLPYMRKSEHVAQWPRDPYPGISPEDAAQALLERSEVDGSSGLIDVSLNSHYFDVNFAVVNAFNELGVKTSADGKSGSALGVFNHPMSVNRAMGTRSYATNTYYCSHSNQSNYHLLTDARVTRVLLSKGDSGLLTAYGVEYSVGGRLFNVTARREVIISAGSVMTPQVLELSGIGNSTILSSFGIPTLLDLPQVGENMQEHLFVTAQWHVKPGVHTYDMLRNDPTLFAAEAEQYNRTRNGLLSTTDSVAAFLPLSQFVNEERQGELLTIFDQEAKTPATKLRREHASLRRSSFQNGDVAAVEVIHMTRAFLAPAPDRNSITLLGGLMHPSSRGSARISSNDPLAPPSIDMNFLESEFDAQLILETLKLLLKVGQTSPLAEFVDVRVLPDPSVQSDEDLLAYIKAATMGGAHILGTAAMAPKEAGGVVDSSLIVHGTANLRIVDASIIPNQLACHTQATVYAIAEKAADMIKATAAKSDPSRSGKKDQIVHEEL